VGNEQRLSQVFLNLLTNASDASSPLGTIVIRSETLIDHAIIKITDEGHGITTTDLKQVMEPFFTTKDPGKGTGLGLAIAQTIIQEHQGDIQIQSPVNPGNEGTCVTVRLPRSASPDQISGTSLT